MKSFGCVFFVVIVVISLSSNVLAAETPSKLLWGVGKTLAIEKSAPTKAAADAIAEKVVAEINKVGIHKLNQAVTKETQSRRRYNTERTLASMAKKLGATGVTANLHNGPVVSANNLMDSGKSMLQQVHSEGWDKGFGLFKLSRLREFGIVKNGNHTNNAIIAKKASVSFKTDLVRNSEAGQITIQTRQGKRVYGLRVSKKTGRTYIQPRPNRRKSVLLRSAAPKPRSFF